MAREKYYVEIKDVKIPLVIRNYKNSNKLKIFLKYNVLNVSKPYVVSDKEALDIIKKNEDEIYKEYIKGISLENNDMRYWQTGEKIHYLGEEFEISRTYDDSFVTIKLDEENKLFHIGAPRINNKLEEKEIIDSVIKDFFKNNTCYIVKERLEYFSKISKIEYNKFRITDSVSKYGSCKVASKSLLFSLRLIMLPKDKIDAIIVHELCHIIYPNHSKDFYDLVKKFIPNYDEIDLWLKENAKIIII